MTKSEARRFFERELRKTEPFKGYKNSYIPMNAGECYEAFTVALESLREHPKKKKRK